MKPFLKVSQIVSTIGRPEATRKVAKGLGLRGPGSSVVVANTPSFRGMVKKLLHLVEVVEVETQSSARPLTGTKR
jgi:large subunit ribosomal protein L30